MISVAIWVAILMLYYFITAKIIKQDTKSDRYIIQAVIIYTVLYLASSSFVIYYIVKYKKTRDYIFLGFQLASLGGFSGKKRR
jgi:hypothetical protein